MKKIAAALALALALSACGTAGGTEKKDYSPQVEKRIERMEAKKDCKGLQKQFDIADKNKKTSVMVLANDAMERVCY